LFAQHQHFQRLAPVLAAAVATEFAGFLVPTTHFTHLEPMLKAQG
jgi:hypothetical protein